MKKHPYRNDKNPQRTLLEFEILKEKRPKVIPKKKDESDDIVIESPEEIKNWMEI